MDALVMLVMLAALIVVTVVFNWWGPGGWRSIWRAGREFRSNERTTTSDSGSEADRQPDEQTPE